eukprot:gene18731-13494_t
MTPLALPMVDWTGNLTLDGEWGEYLASMMAAGLERSLATSSVPEIWSALQILSLERVKAHWTVSRIGSATRSVAQLKSQWGY